MEIAQRPVDLNAKGLQNGVPPPRLYHTGFIEAAARSVKIFFNPK